MKTKLTLTVRKNIIIRAKRYSMKTGKSLSRLFEEMFETEERTHIKTEAQRAAERLLNELNASKPVRTLNDKQLLKNHVARKHA